MKNWLYNDSYNCWLNMDRFVKISILKNGNFFDILAVQNDGTMINLFISESSEQAQDWLNKFMRQKMCDDDFDVKDELELLIDEAKDLKRSLECFIQYENPSAFDSKQQLIRRCQCFSESLIRFAEIYSEL